MIYLTKRLIFIFVSVLVYSASAKNDYFKTSNIKNSIKHDRSSMSEEGYLKSRHRFSQYNPRPIGQTGNNFPPMNQPQQNQVPIFKPQWSSDPKPDLEDIQSSYGHQQTAADDILDNEIEHVVVPPSIKQYWTNNNAYAPTRVWPLKRRPKYGIKPNYNQIPNKWRNTLPDKKIEGMFDLTNKEKNQIGAVLADQSLLETITPCVLYRYCLAGIFQNSDDKINRVVVESINVFNEVYDHDHSLDNTKKLIDSFKEGINTRDAKKCYKKYECKYEPETPRRVAVHQRPIGIPKFPELPELPTQEFTKMPVCHEVDNVCPALEISCALCAIFLPAACPGLCAMTGTLCVAGKFFCTVYPK